MKIFGLVVGIGIAVFAFSCLSSLLGAMASQRSDVGIWAGGLLILILAAVVAQFAYNKFVKSHGSAETKENK